MSEIFDNQHRNRYYGLRVGDIIKCEAYNIKEAKVISYGNLDNNSVVVQEDGKEPRKVVAEWCEIIIKIDRDIKLCDSCGKTFTGNHYPIVNENHRIQKGLMQCQKCYAESID